MIVSRRPGRVRLRVRGLLGNPSLASVLEVELLRLLPKGGRFEATPASGTVVLACAAPIDADALAAACERVLAGRGPETATPSRATAVRAGRSGSARVAVAPLAATPLGASETPSLPAASAPVATPRVAAPLSRRPRRTAAPRPTSPPASTGSGRSVADAHALSLDALMRQASCSAEGLPADEATRRLAQDGPNELLDITGRSAGEILLGQFTSVPVALLAGSGGLSLATRAFADAAAIGAVLAANAGIGYFTESRAERTVSSLRKLAPGEATVQRDGRAQRIPAREVVVGDVLLLRPGDAVAADARVIEAHRLSTNEASLTGESLPVRKQAGDALPVEAPLGERSNMVHMGTVVSGGTGRAIVVATGAGTMLGGIRALAQSAQTPRTHLQEELDALSRKLAIGSALLCAGVFGLGLLRGRPALPLLRTVVSLGVAAIPEGLPAVATSLLASGIRSLQRRGVYARSLEAVENLGAVDTVCFDKTGTLTENRMSAAVATVGLERRFVGGAAPVRGALPDDWLRVAVLCSEVQRNGEGWAGSSTEIALVELALRAGADWQALHDQHPLLATKERSEHHPYMVTLHATPRGGRGRFVAVKGRPAEVLERCVDWFDGSATKPLDQDARASLLQANDELASQGHRVLALACAVQEGRELGETAGLTWLGLVGLADPVREGMAGTIGRFVGAGIRPMMITGDQPGTAAAVARAIGLGEGPVQDAAALPESVEGVADAAASSAVFARSTPGMKLQVVRALQAGGHVVAMTGDGINDGPALKTADVGVAMGVTGTDFAHAMSDLVLRDDHPDALLLAISEGRTAYLNVKKAVRYLLATNLSELAATTIAIGAGLPEPFDPLALLWTNLITDVSPAIALGLEPPEPDILSQPPLRRDGGMLEAGDWRGLGVDAALLTAASLAGFGVGLARYGPGGQAKTMAFMTLTTSQLVFAMTSRSQARIGASGMKRNPLLERVVLGSLALQYGTVLLPPLRRILRTTPLSAGDLAVTTALALAPSVARELMKRGAARTAGGNAAAGRPSARSPRTAPRPGPAGG